MPVRLGFTVIAFVLIGTLVGQATLGDDPEKGTTEKPDRVTLHTQRMDLQEQIKLAAKQVDPDYVLSEHVTGQCSASLYDMTFEQVLDILLPLYDACWYRDDGVIHIVTMEQFEEQQPNDASHDGEKQQVGIDDPQEEVDPPARQAKGGKQNDDKEGQIEINITDLDVHKVFQLLAIQSRRSFFVSGEVDGKVTANLKDVTVDQVIDHILKVNGWKRMEFNGCTAIVTPFQIERWHERENPEAEEAAAN